MPRRRRPLLRWLAVASVSLAACAAVPAQDPGFLSAEQRRQDFETFCRFVADDYAYFDIKATDWARTCAHFGAQAQAAADKTRFVAALEHALQQLYDAHAHLGTHNPGSVRLVPSQADVMAAWSGGKALVTDLRPGSAAARSGLHVGDEIVAINNVAVAQAAAEFEPRFVHALDPEARAWALLAALTGRHEQAEIRLDVRSAGGRRSVAYAPVFVAPDRLLTATTVRRVGHIRIHNALGDEALVRQFDAALAGMQGASALVLDLRDTPSGGNSTVARGVLSRLVEGERAYQRHELPSEFRRTGIRRIWVERVASRGPAFRAPVVVLVGRWTGSMGEGLAIGAHAARGAPVLGRPMARLLGALGEVVLPHSKIVVRIPVEKLSHVDGRPREAFVPCEVAGPPARAAADDPELQAALALARRLARMHKQTGPRHGYRGCPTPVRST